MKILMGSGSRVPPILIFPTTSTDPFPISGSRKTRSDYRSRNWRVASRTGHPRTDRRAPLKMDRRAWRRRCESGWNRCRLIRALEWRRDGTSWPGFDKQSWSPWRKRYAWLGGPRINWRAYERRWPLPRTSGCGWMHKWEHWSSGSEARWGIGEEACGRKEMEFAGRNRGN